MRWFTEWRTHACKTKTAVGLVKQLLVSNGRLVNQVKLAEVEDGAGGFIRGWQHSVRCFQRGIFYIPPRRKEERVERTHKRRRMFKNHLLPVPWSSRWKVSESKGATKSAQSERERASSLAGGLSCTLGRSVNSQLSSRVGQPRQSARVKSHACQRRTSSGEQSKLLEGKRREKKDINGKKLRESAGVDVGYFSRAALANCEESSVSQCTSPWYHSCARRAGYRSNRSEQDDRRGQGRGQTGFHRSSCRYNLWPPQHRTASVDKDIWSVTRS